MRTERTERARQSALQEAVKLNPKGASDRDRLERLCRYIQRPVIAQDRLTELEDGRLYYKFKRTWKSGARGIFLRDLIFLNV